MGLRGEGEEGSLKVNHHDLILRHQKIALSVCSDQCFVSLTGSALKSEN